MDWEFLALSEQLLVPHSAPSTKPGGRDSPKRPARSARSTGTNLRIFSIFKGATPDFSSFEAILSRRDLGRSRSGSSITRAARRKSVWISASSGSAQSRWQTAPRRRVRPGVRRNHVLHSRVKRSAVEEESKRYEIRGTILLLFRRDSEHVSRKRSTRSILIFLADSFE